MTKNKLKALVIAAFLAVVVCCTQMQQPGNNSNNTTAKKDAAPADCPASSAWITDPQGAPGDIPGGGNTLCEFHQFSWQWFLNLMNQPGGGADRAFQDEQNFPLLLASDQNSCEPNEVQSRLFVRTGKNDNGSNDDFTLPERINQAGKSNQATIYDQNGNVVFYEVRFSRSQCSLDPTAKMFPAGTTELKVSYRVITDADKPNYVWINADINADGKIAADELLGMVGFHLVISTPTHPEFIWATFEHKQNAPECQVAADPNAKWSFMSAKCAAELPNSVKSDCVINNAPSGTVLKGGPPTEICKVYHDGADNGDTGNAPAIDALNTQLTGASGLLTALPATNPLAVLKNYVLIGTLWRTTEGKNSTDPGFQVGSIQLANSTMETTFQQADTSSGTAVEVPYTGTANLKPAANCFFCHTYKPGNNVGISHIFDSIKGKKS